MPQPSNQGDESMETISNPGSPLRASTPVVEDDDGIFLEDKLPLERSQEVSEEEGGRQETNLEASLKMEAEMLDNRARRILHASWQEPRDLEKGAAMEAD